MHPKLQQLELECILTVCCGVSAVYPLLLATNHFLFRAEKVWLLMLTPTP